MTKRPRKSSDKSKRDLLLPSAEELERRRRKLPRFQPHDLVQLMSGSGQISSELILKLRTRNDEQVRAVAAALPVHTSDPRYWEKAFFWLAHYCLGLGCMRLRAPKPRSNSSTWTTSLELFLIQEVIALTEKGISERKAIELILADHNKRLRFPYRPQRDTQLEGGYDKKSREPDDRRSSASRDPRTMAVYRHWQQMKGGEWSNLIRMLTGYSGKKTVRQIRLPDLYATI
jgi:hypothetical protein